MLKQPAWTRFLSAHFVINVATLGPVGRFRAPGTWGSLAGLIWFTVVLLPLGPLGALLLSAGCLYLAFAFCGEAEARLQKVDPQEVVLDEFA
ncbi:MAG: phosphatidylglycerophosphatase A, partial [Opitutaceae bacterium]